MDSKEYLTNEYLRKKFKSQFELVKYAIRFASNVIRAGRDSHEHSDENPALVALEAMEDGDLQQEFLGEIPDHREQLKKINNERSQDEKVEKIHKKPNNKKKNEFALKD